MGTRPCSLRPAPHLLAAVALAFGGGRASAQIGVGGPSTDAGFEVGAVDAGIPRGSGAGAAGTVLPGGVLGGGVGGASDAGVGVGAAPASDGGSDAGADAGTDAGLGSAPGIDAGVGVGSGSVGAGNAGLPGITVPFCAPWPSCAAPGSGLAIPSCAPWPSCAAGGVSAASSAQDGGSNPGAGVPGGGGFSGTIADAGM